MSYNDEELESDLYLDGTETKRKPDVTENFMRRKNNNNQINKDTTICRSSER